MSKLILYGASLPLVVLSTVQMSIGLHFPTLHEYGVTDRNSAPAHSDASARRATSGEVAGSGRYDLRRSAI